MNLNKSFTIPADVARPVRVNDIEVTSEVFEALDKTSAALREGGVEAIGSLTVEFGERVEDVYFGNGAKAFVPTEDQKVSPLKGLSNEEVGHIVREKAIERARLLFSEIKGRIEDGLRKGFSKTGGMWDGSEKREWVSSLSGRICDSSEALFADSIYFVDYDLETKVGTFTGGNFGREQFLREFFVEMKRLLSQHLAENIEFYKVPYSLETAREGEAILLEDLLKEGIQPEARLFEDELEDGDNVKKIWRYAFDYGRMHSLNIDFKYKD